MYKVLFVCARKFLPLYVIRPLDRKKYSIYFLGPYDSAIHWSKYLKKFFSCHQSEIEMADEAFIHRINTICIDYQIDCVIPLDIVSSISISRVQKKLVSSVFPVGTQSTIKLLANKWTTFQFASKNGVLCPFTKLIRSPDELRKFTFDKSFLIKPLSLSGGRGIVRIKSKADIVCYLSKPSASKIFPLIVQEEIFGSDLGASLVADHGKITIWTTQTWNEAKSIELINDKEAFTIAEKIVSSAKYSGLMNIDLKRDQQTGKIFLLECNPRAWGSINVSTLAGIDFIEAGILVAKKKNMPIFNQKLVKYEQPKTVITNFLKNPLNFNLSPITKNYFFLVILDPLPYFSILLSILKNLTQRNVLQPE